MEGLERASHTDQARSDPSPGHCDLLGLMGRSATRADVARCNALERKGAEIRGPEVFLNRIITPNKLPDYSCIAVHTTQYRRT